MEHPDVGLEERCEERALVGLLPRNLKLYWKIVLDREALVEMDREERVRQVLRGESGDHGESDCQLRFRRRSDLNQPTISSKAVLICVPKASSEAL